MNRRNTLNTRLLPLSILISSLVSGGAVAALPILTKDSLPKPKVEVQTGDFQRVTDGGSFLLGDKSSAVQSLVDNSAKNPADALQKELQFFFSKNETIDEAKLLVADLEASHAQTIKDLETQLLQLAPEQQEQAREDLVKIKDKHAKGLLQTKAALAYAEDQSDANKDAFNKVAKDNLIAALDVRFPGKFTAEEANAIVNATVTKDTSAISPALQQKVGAVKAQDAYENIKNKLKDYLNKGVITQAQKKKLEADFAEKQEKLDKQTEAQQAQEEAKKANSKALSDAGRLVVESTLAKAKAEKADKAKTDAEAELKALNDDKLAAIQAVDSTWDENTPDIATELQNLIDDSSTDPAKKAEAEVAQKAIANAEAANKLAQDLTAEHTDAAKAAQEMADKYAAAKQVKDDAATALADKTSELDAAVAEVANLEKVTNPTTDTPVLEQIIAKGEAQNVSTDTAAFDSKVAGGKQTVADKGKIIDSIVTEDGVIELATGAQAFDTVIIQGTMTNSGGNDTNTLVGDKGKLELAGADATHIAKSINAKVLAGGEVTLGDHSEVNQMVTFGTVKASGSATLIGTTIEAGELSIAGGAIATGTLQKGGDFIVDSGAKANGTIIQDGTMTVNDGASIKNTTLNINDLGSTLTLESGAKADGTNVHGRNHVFTINAGAEALNTNLYFSNLELNKGVKADGTKLFDGSTFTLQDGAETTNTVVSGDSQFTVTANATANDTTIKSGQFNLMDQAKATKLLVENGSALIAGQLQDAIFKGGKAIFGTTAEVSGTIDSGKDSVISVYDGADTKGADLNLAGNLQLLAGNAPVARTTLKRAAAMTNPAQFAFKNVTLSGGTVDMSSTNTQLTMTSLAGDGTFVLAPSLYNQANAPLNVLGDATGNFGIQLKDNGVAPTNLKIIDVKGVNAARFALTNGPVNLGNYKHTLCQ